MKLTGEQTESFFTDKNVWLTVCFYEPLKLKEKLKLS